MAYRDDQDAALARANALQLDLDSARADLERTKAQLALREAELAPREGPLLPPWKFFMLGFCAATMLFGIVATLAYL